VSKPLVEKYNIPAPRYTSYPTVPYWEAAQIDATAWSDRVSAAFHNQKELSLYIHLPYCEQLCTYCGCNKHITTNHRVEQPYIDSVLAEWAMYTRLLGERPVLRELHLGGGTPTFFSPENLAYLIEGILAGADVAPQTEFSFEAHPFSTTHAHLATLRRLGFNRISVGVQDVSPEILAIINRAQTVEQVENVTRRARELGYESVNFDLIFGLPLQTPTHISDTMQLVGRLRPERIAFYSYAHVPWVKPSQRAYSEADLPEGEAKRALYEWGRELLEREGYVEIGLDHFALPGDSLYHSMQQGTLHRNFMGYTPYSTRLCIGLGASAIGDTWDAYAQNEKRIVDYQQRIAKGELPLTKGHLLSPEDQVIREHILRLMCQGFTTWEDPRLQCDALWEGLERLTEMEEDGLVSRSPYQLRVTEAGLPFLRNICLALDARYWRAQPEAQLFSKVV
jgi:oxygen-independent coproporphyrinogen-3 oxidase